jgi:hypothetical protein
MEGENKQNLSQQISESNTSLPKRRRSLLSKIIIFFAVILLIAIVFIITCYILSLNKIYLPVAVR